MTTLTTPKSTKERSWMGVLGLHALLLCLAYGCDTGPAPPAPTDADGPPATWPTDAGSPGSRLDASPPPPAGDSMSMDAATPEGGGSQPSPDAATTRDASPSSDAAMPAGPGVPVQLLETEQTVAGLRPELLDWLWNNLDAAHFTQWYPAGHEAFEWQVPPDAPGDLGAEPGARYRATVVVADVPHELVVTYLARDGVDPPPEGAYAMAAQVTLDGQGPLHWTVGYDIDDQTLTVRQRLELPEELDAQAWMAHLRGRIDALAEFLPPWFQQQYVEGELLTRGTSDVTNELAAGVLKVRVEQTIGRLTPEMVDWWWDNIDSTARYRRWHPTAHLEFTWLTPPEQPDDGTYDVGAVQRVVETIGSETTLDITWLEPSEAPIALTYGDHFVYGSAMLADLPLGGFLLHEYAAAPEGGITMISHFEITNLADLITPGFGEQLADHCQQEMQFLQYFLPALYAAEHASN